MLSLLPIFSLAQVTVPTPAPTSEQRLMVQPQDVRSLPGQLDRVPMFNSNSPEVVKTPGILLSTFPPTDKATPDAHLDKPLEGRFDFFSHHIARANNPEDSRPFYQGAIVYNPGAKPVKLDIMQAVSYVTNPDAPFIELPPHADNPTGTVYSGPGSRVMNDILRGVHHTNFPSQIVIPPRESRMLFNLPIALGNARSTFMRLRSNGPVYLANLAMPAPRSPEAKEDRGESSPSRHRAPTLTEWQELLQRGELAEPRDLPPTPLEEADEDIIYGRVAGIALGSQWRSAIADNEERDTLSIPKRGEAFSYVLSTLNEGTLGTNQVQSAPMLVRYPDTAYRAHGNYGVHYHLRLPLHNNTNDLQTIALTIQTPIKFDDEHSDELRFLEPPDRRVFFRGTVQVRYSYGEGLPRTRYVHLVQRRGEQGEPLLTLTMPPDARRVVEVDFLYPPDATPPQVLTVRTLEGVGEVKR